jgi:hypothetical protein
MYCTTGGFFTRMALVSLDNHVAERRELFAEQYLKEARRKHSLVFGNILLILFTSH